MLILKVEAYCGQDLPSVFGDMVGIADRVGAMVECHVNGAKVFARPGDDPARLHRAFLKWLTVESKFPVFANDAA